MDRRINTRICCPQCDGQGRQQELYTSQGEHAYTCPFGHRYTDIEQLRSLNPKSLGPAPAPPPFPNVQTEAVRLPAQLLANLRQKYGTALEKTIVAVLVSVEDPKTFLVTAEDINEITTAARTCYSALSTVPGYDPAWGGLAANHTLENSRELVGAFRGLAATLSELASRLNEQFQRRERQTLQASGVEFDLSKAPRADQQPSNSISLSSLQAQLDALKEAMNSNAAK